MKLHNRNEKYISQYQARILVVTKGEEAIGGEASKI